MALRSTHPDPKRIVEFVTGLVYSSVHPSMLILTKVVMLVNLPFAVATLMAAYEDLFGSRPAPTT